MQSAPNSSRHIPELDGVRGIACIFIVLLHCLIGISSAAPGSFVELIKGQTMPFLIGGVDLFFVLSGLLIGGILLDNRGASNFFRAFWTRRIARIFPVNYALVASYALVLAVQNIWHFPQLDIFALAPPVHSPLWYATFTQSIPFALTDWGPRWMGITWSLAIEEQFYLLFPLVVYFLPRRHVVMLTIVAIVASPLLFAAVEWITGRSDTAYVLLPCRMSALFLGVLVACIIRNDRAFGIARRFRILLDLAILLIVYSASHQWLVKQYFSFVEQGYVFAAILFHAPLEYLA
jgi:peptidoglycan/LPS O-acetylase OafA/YrhL